MPFIFSRRYIQQCLDHLSGSLSLAQREDLVARLNKKTDDRLPAMWEAVMLNMFSGFPEFQHEAPLIDGRKPDFQCKFPKSEVLIVGDITSVSDKGYHEQNPIDFFLDELDRVAKKYQSDRSQFHIQVHSIDKGRYDRRKVMLLIPKGDNRQEFFKNEFEPYIRERLQKEDYGHRQLFRTENYSIEINFKPKSNYASWGHPSYTSVLNIDRNPVWNRLKDKAEQLKNTPKGAIRLVSLCDGGSEAMRKGGIDGRPGRDEIVSEFLRRHSSIDVVLMFTVVEVRDGFGQSEKMFSATRAVRKAWADTAPSALGLLAELAETLNERMAQWPQPNSNAQSAVKNVTKIDYSIGALGGYKREGKKLRISARAVQKLLAGEINIEEFNEAHGWTRDNPFAYALKRGRTITGVSIEMTVRQDDDWLEFEFRDDAELQPFR